jgi:hypothetical protein
MTIRRGGGRLEDMIALGSLGRCPYLSQRGGHHGTAHLCSVLATTTTCSILSQSTFTGAFRFSPLFYLLRALPAAYSAYLLTSPPR